MEKDTTQKPKSAVWPKIRAQVIEKYGDVPMAHDLGEGRVMRATVKQAFEECVDLDLIGNENPQLLLGIIQKGMDKAAEA